jgi:thiamine kinase-like enzyme
MKANPASETHKNQVIVFLQKAVKNQQWLIEHPPYGRGQETYFARSAEDSFFIKLGADTRRYKIMSGMGIAPDVIATGLLEDGSSILVQQWVSGRMPSRQDFREQMHAFAHILLLTHQSENLKGVLPQFSSQDYKSAGVAMIAVVEKRWLKIKPHVLALSDEVDQKIQYLKDHVEQFTGSGLVASHNDVCNGNWLIAQDGRIYLLDYEMMALDDPAADLGAILWWYYPPEMRGDFIGMAGYEDNKEFRFRMRIRMAVHALNIILPRADSFDRFSSEMFGDALVDFRALVAGEENPQGY